MAKAHSAATELKCSFSSVQHGLIRQFSEGLISLIIFEGLQRITSAPIPAALPKLDILENDYDVLCMAARSQVLLKLVDHRTFAYDIDNDGKVVRLVGNFKGGGAQKIGSEPEYIELSSHSGQSLGPHTEAPYWCAVKAENGHSPSPSALILSALWNPGNEPTSVIPLPPVLEKLGVENSLALTARSFNFTRSDSFVNGKGAGGKSVSILDFNETLGLVAKFNSYRFSVDAEASPVIRKAFAEFCDAVGDAKPYRYTLDQESAIVINNNRALHCRDVVKDNRRLLVRLFGASKFSEPVIASEDPLIFVG